MRTYIITACVVLALLLLSIGYERKIIVSQDLELDSEQKGLKDQLTLTISHVVAEDTPKGRAIIKFAHLVEKYSDNSIHVEIYPNGMLYNDNNEVEALKSNKVQLIAPTFSKLTTYAPSWKVLDLPYLFHSDSEVQTVLNGEIGQKLLKDLQNNQMRAIGFWQNGFKQYIAKDKLIIQPSDLRGVRMRVMPSQLLHEQFQLLGAIPISTSFDEIFTKMEDKDIHAMENTLSNIYSKGFYIKDRHITISNHGLLGYGAIMNEQFYERLNDSQKRAIERAMQETSKWTFDMAKSMNDQSLEKLRKKNVQIYALDEEELIPWKQSYNRLYTGFLSKNEQQVLKDIQSVLVKDRNFKK